MVLWPLIVAIPLVGLALLLLAPETDFHWEHHPAHFWLVLSVSLVSVALASYGDVVADEGGSTTHVALWTVGLVLVVATVTLPSLTSIALTACLVLAGIQGAVALGGEIRRRPTP